MLSRFAFAIILSFFTLSVSADENEFFSGLFDNPGPKSERNYLSFGLNFNEFQKLTLNLVESARVNYEFELEDPPRVTIPGMKAHTYGMSIIYGTYLDDTFRTEFRYGQGVREDTLEGAKDINMDYWFSMFFGADQDITDYLRAHLLLGISYFQAEVTRREVVRRVPAGDNISEEELRLQPSAFSDDPNLFGENFSFGWLVGLDYKLSDQWYLTFEYGLPFEDSDNNIEVDQYSAYLKFEF